MAVAYNPATMASQRFTTPMPMRTQEAETQMSVKNIIESIIDDYNESQQGVAEGLEETSQKGGMLGGGAGLAASGILALLTGGTSGFAQAFASLAPYITALGTGYGTYRGQKGNLGQAGDIFAAGSVDDLKRAEKKLESITKEGIKGREIGSAYDEFQTLMDDQALTKGLYAGGTSLALSGILPGVTDKLGFGADFLGQTVPQVFGQTTAPLATDLTVSQLLRKPGAQALNALLSSRAPKYMSGSPRSI